MKITINVDCTPEEARAFMGLPDVQPLQEAALKAMQDQMTETMAKMDPETVMKTLFPAGLEGLETMQKAFWSQFTGTAGKD